MSSRLPSPKLGPFSVLGRRRDFRQEYPRFKAVGDYVERGPGQPLPEGVAAIVDAWESQVGTRGMYTKDALRQKLLENNEVLRLFGLYQQALSEGTPREFLAHLNELLPVLEGSVAPEGLSAGAAALYRTHLEDYADPIRNVLPPQTRHGLLEDLTFFIGELMGTNRGSEGQRLLEYVQRERDLDWQNKKPNEAQEDKLLATASPDDLARQMAKTRTAGYGQISADERNVFVGLLHANNYDSRLDVEMQEEAGAQFAEWKKATLARLQSENLGKYEADHQARQQEVKGASGDLDAARQRISDIETFGSRLLSRENALATEWRETIRYSTDAEWTRRLSTGDQGDQQVRQALRVDTPKTFKELKAKAAALRRYAQERKATFDQLQGEQGWLRGAKRVIGQDRRPNLQADAKELGEVAGKLEAKIAEIEMFRREEAARLEVEGPDASVPQALRETARALEARANDAGVSLRGAEIRLENYRNLLAGKFFYLTRTLVMDAGQVRELDVSELSAMHRVPFIAPVIAKMIQWDILGQSSHAAGTFKLVWGQFQGPGDVRPRNLGKKEVGEVVEWEKGMQNYVAPDRDDSTKHAEFLADSLADFAQRTSDFTWRVLGARILRELRIEAARFGVNGVAFKGRIELNGELLLDAA